MTVIHSNLQLILGPPGTGKTESLLKIMEEEFKNGIKPSEIAYVSFTRKATYEALDRARKRFNYTRRELPYFRTLHSMAFYLLNLHKGDVVGPKEIIDFAKSVGEYILIRSDPFDTATETDGSLMMFIDNFYRNKLINLREAWRQISDDKINFERQEWFSKSYENYKKTNFLYDFTDIINNYNKIGIIPRVKIVIIDEAQDLSMIQWMMVQKLSLHAERVYIAGDDDQAIYAWSGAATDYFLSLQSKKKIVLKKSYRLPVNIYNLAISLSNRIQKRFTKNWSPTRRKGQVKYVDQLNQVPLKEGDWYILVRNKCYAEEIAETISTMGYSYSIFHQRPLEEDAMIAIKAYVNLLSNKKITVNDAIKIYKYLEPDIGRTKGSAVELQRIENKDLLVDVKLLRENYGFLAKETWEKSLTGLSKKDTVYVKELMKNGETLKKPRIKINTIHGVKGGETDNVLLLTDMTYRTFKGYEEDEDNEHRIFYVGATRARNKLFVMSPNSEYNYII